MQRSLRLVHTPTPTHPPTNSACQSESVVGVGVVAGEEVGALFEHWALMTGQQDARLGPTRRTLLERWLAVYPAEVLRLAFEGCGASRWAAGENQVQRPLNGLVHILRDEDTIERWAQAGRQLRQRAEAAQQRQQAASEAPADPEVKRRSVAALAEMARRLRGSR